MHRLRSANQYEFGRRRLLAAGLLAVAVTASAALLQRPAEAQAPPDGTFASGGSLGSPRGLHAAALLNDGRILVYGGGNTASADLYDPATGRTEFLATPTSEPMVYARMTTLLDGRVLVTGGYRLTPADQPDVPVATALLYDPRGRTWSSVGPMTVARAHHTATRLQDGRVLVVGGLDMPTGTRATNASLRTAEIFDPTTGRFTPTGSLTLETTHHTATLLKNGKVLVAGVAGLFSHLYDPATGTFAMAASVSALRLEAESTLLDDGTVLIVGGTARADGPGLTTAERYDPATGRFTAVGPLSEGRVNHTLTTLPNGRAIVVGGDAGGTSVLLRNTTEVFDPVTNKFVPGPRLVAVRTVHTATALPDGRVIVTGGFDGTNLLPSIEVFTPAVPAKPYAGSAPAAGSQSLLVTTRVATAEDLVKALSTDGCSARVIAYLQSGTWQIYLPGAPTVVNAAFPASLAATTPLFIGCN